MVFAIGFDRYVASTPLQTECKNLSKFLENKKYIIIASCIN